MEVTMIEIKLNESVVKLDDETRKPFVSNYVLGFVQDEHSVDESERLNFEFLSNESTELLEKLLSQEVDRLTVAVESALDERDIAETKIDYETLDKKVNGLICELESAWTIFLAFARSDGDYVHYDFKNLLNDTLDAEDDDWSGVYVFKDRYHRGRFLADKICKKCDYHNINEDQCGNCGGSLN